MKRTSFELRSLVFLTVLACLFGAGAATSPAETLWVDDDAPADPGPGDPTVSDPLEDGSPEHPFDAIQEALDAAGEGDTIIVRDGTYTGDGNRDIEFRGRGVHLRSENGPDSCIIDCQGTEDRPHRGFYFRDDEDQSSILDGFTITNGYSQEGGGISCRGTSPTIINNVVMKNAALHSGGGISCMDSSPTIAHNEIKRNTAFNFGGGVSCVISSAAITNNVVTGNAAPRGGGILCWFPCSAVITNDTITDNWSMDGAGIACMYDASPVITNCIVWNTGDNLSGCSATFSCIKGGSSGTGNISTYPHFIDRANGDYHLRSYSPCIDAGSDAAAGDIDHDIDGEQRIMLGRVDMGADESPVVSPDDDGDGLPDEWETAYLGNTAAGPGDDPDHDGLTNEQEYELGSSPNQDNRTIYVGAANAGDPLADGTAAHPYATIQRGIDAALETVCVAEGTYRGSLIINGKGLDIRGGYSADFSERGPDVYTTVIYTTVIDALSSASAVSFHGASGGSLSGFTITGATAWWDGSIYCRDSTLTLSENAIINNPGRAGIDCVNCTVTIQDNTIAGNGSDGIWCRDSTATITGNHVEANNGEGINCERSGATVTDNTVTGNTWGGISIGWEATEVTIVNNAVTDNHGWGIGASAEFGPVTVSENHVSGNRGGITVSQRGDATGIISDNTVIGNTLTGRSIYGAGIYAGGGEVCITRNIVRGNTSDAWRSVASGGGIATRAQTSTITGNLIVGNHGATNGGGLYIGGFSGSPHVDAVVDGNTISGNTSLRGGGIACRTYASALVTNTILAGNDAAWGTQVYYSSWDPVTFEYCNVQGGDSAVYINSIENREMLLTWGEGNLDADPLFADVENGDYHLRSRGGRWDPAADGGQGAWVVDEVHSPCIDAGNPTNDASSEPTPNGGRINMGIYGNTPWASRSYTGPTRQITVRSTPTTGVPITGTIAGTTDFTATVPEGARVQLHGWRTDDGLFFLRWEDETGTLLTRRGVLDITMDTHKTVIAVYGPVTDFYVNDATPDEGVAAGDDANTGTSSDSPMGCPQSLLYRYRGIGSGCTLHMAPGIYRTTIEIGTENSGLALMGASPGRTVVDGVRNGSCLTLRRTGDCLVYGITFTNGESDSGSGVHCFGSSAVLSNIIIAGNRATHPNPEYAHGGGLGCGDSSELLLLNCVITGNAADGFGGGISSRSPVTLADSIVWGNSAGFGHSIWLRQFKDDAPSLSARYSVIEGGQDDILVDGGCSVTWGSGNIDADPLFAAPGHWDDNGTPDDPDDDVWVDGDYHLKSEFGRWDPAANDGQGAWVSDAVSSPSIDAGDPESEYSNEPMPNFGRVNMGAYGNTAEASKSGWNIPGDANGDCKVSVLDLIYVRNLLGADPATGENWQADVNQDGKINILDLIHVRNRLNTTCKD